MSLSCECETDGFEWWYSWNGRFSLFPLGRTKCCSCKSIIKTSEQCLIFDRSTDDKFGDETELSSWFMCENCGEIYLNLDALGYCMYIDQESMPEMLKQYHELTGFKSNE